MPLLLVAMFATSSDALFTSSDALATSSFYSVGLQDELISTAAHTSSDALVTSSNDCY